MTEKYAHKRSTDPEPLFMEHERERAPSEVPAWVRWSVYAIDKIGFSSVVVLLLLFKLDHSINKNTEASNRYASVMETLLATFNSNHVEAQQWRFQYGQKIDRISERLPR